MIYNEKNIKKIMDSKLVEPLQKVPSILSGDDFNDENFTIDGCSDTMWDKVLEQ